MLKPRLCRIGLFASALAGMLATVAGISADAQDYNWNHNADWNRNRGNWNGNRNWNSGRYSYGYAGYGAGRAAAWGAAAGTAAAIGSTVYSPPAGCASYNGYYNCGSSWYQPSVTGYFPPYGIADSD